MAQGRLLAQGVLPAHPLRAVQLWADWRLIGHLPVNLYELSQRDADEFRELALLLADIAGGGDDD